MTALRHDVAHLGHAELLTPEPERSLEFFVNILGLTETGRATRSTCAPGTTTSSSASS